MSFRSAPASAPRMVRLALVLALLPLGTGAIGAQQPGVAAVAPSSDIPDGVATFDSAWSIIHRRHFDTTFGGTDWVALRDTLRPRAVAAKDVEELRVVIREMIARLRLSHYALLSGDAADALTVTRSASARPGSVGLELRNVAGAVLVSRVEPGSPAARAGIRRGWTLRRIDSTSVAPPAKSGLDAHQAAMQATAAAVARLQGAPGTSVRLELRDARGRTVRRTLARVPVEGVAVNFGHLPTMYVRFASHTERAGDARIGVLRFNVWMPVIMPQIDAAIDSLRGSDGLVFDLRGNPGGVAGMVMGSAGHLIDSAVALGVMRSRENTLRFVTNPRRANAKGERVTPFAGPVAVLVDEMSASTSEFFAAGLQEVGRARVFGARTSGQALPAMLTRLPNGDVLYHAVADFTTPKGTRLEKDGVVPDEAVPLTRADLLAGRDAAMEAALRWIAAQPRSR